MAAYDDANKGVIVNLSNSTQLGVAGGTAQDGQGGTDTLVNIVSVYGSSFADTMFGSDNSDFFAPLGGNDSIVGGDGDDALDFYDSTDGVTVNLNTQGIAQSISASNGKDTFTDIEQVWGSFHNDVLTGDAQDNFLQGRDGNDKIVGGAGFDELEGGSGNDTITGGADPDRYKLFLLDASGKDLITDFSKTDDRLAFFDVFDNNKDGQIDIEDVDEAIDSFVNGGAGKNVTINFDNGSSIVFQGAGTASAINSIGDLVDDPATQIVINSL
jgi:Ca2+-binding RTX toxin-like protein